MGTHTDKGTHNSHHCKSVLHKERREKREGERRGRGGEKGGGRGAGERDRGRGEEMNEHPRKLSHGYNRANWSVEDT